MKETNLHDHNILPPALARAVLTEADWRFLPIPTWLLPMDRRNSGSPVTTMVGSRAAVAIVNASAYEIAYGLLCHTASITQLCDTASSSPGASHDDI